MKEFLNEYVKDVAEARDIELDSKTLEDIVNSLMQCDEIWEVLDEHIDEEFSEKGVM